MVYINFDFPSNVWKVEQGEDFDRKRWERKRKWTTRVFVLECLMLGMEYSVTFLTLWLYLKTLVDTNYPKIFYSLIASAYLLGAVVFSVIIGRWVDKSRKVRLTFLCCNTLVIIGNIIYALHFSPWLLVLGRLISGADGPLRSVISGEIARVYPTEEVLGKFSTMGMAFALGFIMGPGVNFLFTTVNFQIGVWQITFVNVIGLYMALFFFITQLCVIFLVSDLSREFDLKTAELGQLIEEKENIEKLRKKRENEDNKPRVYFQKEKSGVPYKTDVEASTQITEASFKYENSSRFDFSTSVKFGRSVNRLNESTRLLDSNRMVLSESTPLVDSTLQNESIRASRGTSFTPATATTMVTSQSLRKVPTETSTSYKQPSTSFKYTQFNDSEAQFTFETNTYDLSASTRRRRKGIGIDKLSQSFLFSQSFAISDCFVTASMLMLLRNEQKQEPLIEEIPNEAHESETVMEVLKQMVTNFDCMLVILFTFCLWYWMVAFDMWLPLMVIDVMGMGINELNGIVFGFGCISAVILFILSYKTFSDRTLFKFSLGCMVSLAIMEVIFVTFKYFHNNLALNVILWFVWGTLFAIVVVMDEVFLVGALAKMVTSNIQTFSESIRLAMSRFGALLALLTSAILFEYVQWVCVFGVLFSIVALLLLLWRRKTLSNPKISIH